MLGDVVLQGICARLERREIAAPAFIEACTRHVAAHVRCSRAGIWMFLDTAEGQLLRCLSLYDAVSNRMTRVPDETDSQVGSYFDALKRDGQVIAADAQHHPATAGFFNKSLRASQVCSLMAVCFSVNGQLFGAFTCTQVGRQVNWSPAQLAMLKRIGSRASLALVNGTRSRTETLPAPLWD